MIAQEFVNRFRRQRRLVSLDEESEDGAQFAATDSTPAAVVDPRVEAATDEVLSRTAAEDRFILASYYLDGRTLAEIARTLAVHESTISRKLDKLAKSLRKQILTALERKGLSRRQAEEAMEVDVRDLRLNIRKRVAQETGPPAFSDKKGEVQASGRRPSALGLKCRVRTSDVGPWTTDVGQTPGRWLSVEQPRSGARMRSPRA